jgi:intein/homing endonuclease
MVSSRWRQDNVVHDLIDYFNDPRFFDKRGYPLWDELSSEEVRIISEELGRCRKDFVYAARNYFYIASKALGDILFSLWPAQELLLEKLLELKSKGLPQKLLVIKARQLGCCLDPATRVLTSDLRWIPIEEVTTGMELLSVDEFPMDGKNEKKSERKMRPATVIARKCVYDDAYKITMENGAVLIATGDHRFLCKERSGSVPTWVSVNSKRGTRTRSPIRVGDSIRYVSNPWDGITYDDAWFGGMIDGEGSFRARPLPSSGMELTVSQTFNEALERAINYVEKSGYTYRIEMDDRKAGELSKLGNKPVAKICINRTDELLKVIGKCRPARFVSKNWWDGRGLPGKKSGTAWVKVSSIEPLGKRRMIDLQTSTKTFIAEGFVSHNSTVTEALIAHRTMFFKNVNCMVISSDKDHVSDVIFPIMTMIYDRMPWFLQADLAMRKSDTGLWFANPDESQRKFDPGLNSRVYIKGATSLTGVGQGIRLSGCHFSEFCDTDDYIAKSIIQEDLTNALIETPPHPAFAILESTAKGANRWAHKLWKKNIELGEDCEWTPLFFPFFMESSRVRVVMPGWHVDRPEELMRERVEREWVRCDNQDCLQFHPRYIKMWDRSGDQCPTCKAGRVHPYTLFDDQCSWYEHRRKNAAHDNESAKILKQEMAVSGEEAFVVTGFQVFGDDAQEWANSTIIEPPTFAGHFDKQGIFHSCDMRKATKDMIERRTAPCLVKGCDTNHWYDDDQLHVWELPQAGAEYVVGADVAEGLGGEADYSTGSVVKINRKGGADYQVAIYRSNTIDTISFAYVLNWLGLWYNEAMMSIECNKYDTTASYVRFQLNYPNLYRWKHLDSLNALSNKLNWYTQANSRPRLWQTYKRWMQSRLLYIRDRVTATEMGAFVKDDWDDRGASGSEGSHDDALFATMIALYTGHESDYSDALGYIPLRPELTMDTAEWLMSCKACGDTWPANSPADFTRCPKCNNYQIFGNRRIPPSSNLPQKPDYDLWEGLDDTPTAERAYELL